MAVFSILITSSADGSQGPLSALRFVEAALKKGHSIKGIFFYYSGVTVANSFQLMLNDELSVYQKFSVLANKHHLSLQVCVTAANRRGLISAEDANDASTGNNVNLVSPFQSVGLGELVENIRNCDRSIQF